MAVNTLVTGMIVFRILKVRAGVERTLGSTGDTKFRHIMFVIIESGMALFAIQLVRVVLAVIPEPVEQVSYFLGAEDIVIAINEMLDKCDYYKICSFLLLLFC
jgi:hypothetical protein